MEPVAPGPCGVLIKELKASFAEKQTTVRFMASVVVSIQARAQRSKVKG